MNNSLYVLILNLAIFAVPFTTVTKPSPQDQAPKATSHDEDRQDKQSNHRANVSTETQKDVPLQTPTAEEGKESKDSAKIDWWTRISNVVMALGTLAIAVIGGIAASAAIRTLRVIERQTKAAEDAAIAAKTSADALIASERAWVMVDLEKAPGGGFVEYATRPDGSPYTVMRVRCICSNQGKTPAKISEKRACLQVTASGQRPSHEPNLAIEICDSTPHYLQSGQPSTHECSIQGEGQGGFGDMVLIYGVVYYRHLFSSKVVQTTFGYRLTADDNLVRLEGQEYEKYNDNT